MKTAQPAGQRAPLSLPRIWNSLRERLRGISSEQEQAIIRIGIQGIFLAYWYSGPGQVPVGSSVWVTGNIYITSAMLLGTAILVLAFARPQYKKLTRTVAIFADAGAVSLGLVLTGVNGAPWYGLYLWITLGNGFRYGESYLYLSGIACLMGFAAVVRVTPYWLDNQQLAIGLAATLVVIPAYSATLIRRLNAARQRADAASRAKGDFLSRMSHEIRTPLNGILGMTDLLRTRPLEPQDMDYVETIYASGKNPGSPD